MPQTAQGRDAGAARDLFSVALIVDSSRSLDFGRVKQHHSIDPVTSCIGMQVQLS